jgi:hypothetical protein
VSWQLTDGNHQFLRRFDKVPQVDLGRAVATKRLGMIRMGTQKKLHTPAIHKKGTLDGTMMAVQMDIPKPGRHLPSQNVSRRGAEIVKLLLRQFGLSAGTKHHPRRKISVGHDITGRKRAAELVKLIPYLQWRRS